MQIQWRMISPQQSMFDDLFTNMIFLSVEAFSGLFFAMIALFLVRDIIRDCGYGFMLWDWLTRRNSQNENLEVQARKIMFRFYLAEQNLLSELVGVLVIPFIVVVDLAFSAVGFGVDTITYKLTTVQKLELLQMYSVLICGALLTHVIVMRIVHKQLHDFSLRSTSVGLITAAHRQRSEKVSILASQWSTVLHEKSYWKRHRTYFAAVISFSIVFALSSATTLKHLP